MRGDDGLTPYQRMRGRPWRIDLPMFGEVVDFMRRTRCKFQSRWETGVYAGVRVETTEKIVLTERGAFVVQSIRRRPEGSRVDEALLANTKATPWKTSVEAEDPADLPMPIIVEPLNPDVPREDTEAALPKERAGARYYILRGDLEKHGYTAACPACMVTQAGVPRRGELHTPDCRARIERAV